MKVVEQKIRSLYHSTVFLWLVSEFLRIFSFFRVCLCRHFVCFSPVSRPCTQILSLFILAAILNKFPLSVDKSVTWFLLCARVLSPTAAISESEKTMGTRLSAHIQKNRLTNTGNDAFDFLGKRVFSEKNNDAIKQFWTDVLFLRKRSRHRQTQRPYVCHPKNERKRKVFLLFFVWFYLNM